MIQFELKIQLLFKQVCQAAITLLCPLIAALGFFSTTTAYGDSSAFVDTGRNSRGYKDAGGNLDLTLGLGGSSGTMKSQGGSIASRSLTTLTANSRVGIRSGFMEPFIYGEYSYAQQTTAAITVANSNLSGSGYLAGIGFGITTQKWLIAATYLGYGTYTPTQLTAAGQSTSYANPIGYHFLLEYSIHSGWSVAAFYKTVDYSKSTIGGVDNDITSDKLSQSTAGAALEWSF